MSDRVTKATFDDDPERCQSSTKFGPCPNKALPGCKFCAIHGGVIEQQSAERDNLRTYRSAKYLDRIKHMSDRSRVKAIHEEIGILKMLVEEMLDTIKDPIDLLMRAGPISELIMKITSCVSVLDKIEHRAGELLNKSAIMAIALNITSIIKQALPDQPELLAKICAEITECVSSQTNPTDKR